MVSIWDTSPIFIFGWFAWIAYFAGGGILVLTWAVRRWTSKEDHRGSSVQSNPFETAGLGSAKLIRREGVPGGVLYRMQLPIGTTYEDVNKKKVELAQIAGVKREQVHVNETESERIVEILILSSPDGFGETWDSPDFAGDSIVQPITYASYDTGTRPELFLAGKDGGSSQHFLTVGLSGTGKSKAWQVIYGSVLTRIDVSVVFGDPAKGMQTGQPLAAGLEWFETSEAGCMDQIDAVIRAIPARTDYLTSKGLDHWVPGCELNFIIFHLEEAGRFSDVEKLVELVEAARSAGIMIVLSLQKATSDRIKTATRYNLGGNMCFGVKMKRDSSFGLSEYAIQAGAAPHRWQDKFPGMHYLEAHGIDVSMVGHPIKTDWVDPILLESIIDDTQDGRRALDSITAEAFGSKYYGYRSKFDAGTTVWQNLRRNRGFHEDTMPQEPVNDTINQKVGFLIPQEETQAAKDHLRDIISSMREEGVTSFIPQNIVDKGFTEKSRSTLHRWLKVLVKEGVLQFRDGTYFIV